MQIEIERKVKKGEKWFDVKLSFSSPEEEETFKDALRYYRYRIPDHNYLEEWLSSIFEKQGKFYEFIGFRYDTNHHPSDSTFSHGCDGFSQFIADIGGEEKFAQVAAQALAKFFEQKINAYLAEKSKQIRAQANIVFAPLPTEQKLTTVKPELNDVLLVTNEGVFKLVAIKTQLKSIDDVYNLVNDSLKESYEMQVQAMTESLKEEIEELRKQLEEERKNAFLAGLKTFQILQDMGWKIRDGELYLSKKIIADKVKYNNNIYPMPKDITIYAQGIHVKIKPTIYETDTHVDNFFHPNINPDEGYICLGDLKGASLEEVVMKLPEMLTVANLDSAYPGDAREVLEEAFEEDEESDEEVSNVWNA